MGKKKYFLVLDTETCDDIRHPLVYDIGAKIIDLKGITYRKGSWVVYDIYCGERELMKSAYYAEKLPFYEQELKSHKRTMKKFFNIRKILLGWMEEFNIEGVVACNTGFDVRALDTTMRHIMNNRFVKFFPKDTIFYDTWTMACYTIFNSNAYYKVAYENGWYSDKGNVRTTAEVAYSYLSKQYDFVESHTALEDVEIESQIFLHCWGKTTPEQRKMMGNPWNIPQKEWYYYEAKREGII